MTPLFSLLVCLCVLKLYTPHALVFVPLCACDLCVKLQISIKIPLLHSLLEILQDLCAAGIETRPFGIGVEWEGVDMSGNVTLNAWVVVDEPMLPRVSDRFGFIARRILPCPSDFVVCLEKRMFDYVLHFRKAVLEFVRHE